MTIPDHPPPRLLAGQVRGEGDDDLGDAGERAGEQQGAGEDREAAGRGADAEGDGGGGEQARDQPAALDQVAERDQEDEPGT